MIDSILRPSRWGNWGELGYCKFPLLSCQAQAPANGACQGHPSPWCPSNTLGVSTWHDRAHIELPASAFRPQEDRALACACFWFVHKESCPATAKVTCKHKVTRWLVSLLLYWWQCSGFWVRKKNKAQSVREKKREPAGGAPPYVLLQNFVLRQIFHLLASLPSLASYLWKAFNLKSLFSSCQLTSLLSVLTTMDKKQRASKVWIG